jgi:hypothetical protein
LTAAQDTSISVGDSAAALTPEGAEAGGSTETAPDVFAFTTPDQSPQPALLPARTVKAYDLFSSKLSIV